jgi:tetratricopeptide (TPR) repeat protein
MGCGGDPAETGNGGVEPPPEARPGQVDPAIREQLEELLRAAREAPGDAGRRVALGMAYEVAGLMTAAERCYAQAEQLDPRDPRHPYFRALTRALLGDLTGALTSMDRALEQEPGYVPALLYRGQWLLDLGRVEEARASFQRATVRDSASDAAWIGLARAHLKAGEHERALSILENVTRRSRHPQVYQLLGLAYREAGDLERARAALAQGRPGPMPAWPDPWSREKSGYLAGFGAGLRRAEALLDRGQAAAALELLESLRVEHPDDVVLLNNLAVAYGQAGSPDRALQLLREGLERHPDYYPVHLNIANRYHEQGELNEAIRHLDLAIAINPTLGWAHQQKARFMAEAGRLDAARAAIDRALALDAGSAVWFLFASQLEGRLGNWPRARERAAQAVHIDPASAEAYLALSRAQARSGDTAGARESLDRAARLGADRAAVEDVARLVGGGR